MNLHIITSEGFSRELPDVAYFSVYPHGARGSEALLRIEYRDGTTEYVKLETVHNIWSRENESRA